MGVKLFNPLRNRRKGRGVVPFGIAVVLLAACNGASDKSAALARTSPSDKVTALPMPSPANPVQGAIRQSLRQRRFDEVLTLIDRLPKTEQARPEFRFLIAYAALKRRIPDRAIVELNGLEAELPGMQSEIERLRREAQLLSPIAMTAAAQLAESGDSTAFERAALSLDEQGQHEGCLSAIEKGLAHDNGRKRTSNGSVHRDRLLSLRVRAAEKLGRADLRLLTLRRVAEQADGPVNDVTLLESAWDEDALALAPSTRLSLLRRLAERGSIERVDRGASELVGKGKTALRRAEAEYLRGRARLIARRDQIAGAKWLTWAADHGYSDASEARFDAAKLYLREGDAESALRLYDKVAALDVRRREQAQYYAARTESQFLSKTKAEVRYALLLAKYPRGAFSDEALYERALNHLALRRYDVALNAFRRLSNDERFRSRRATLLELAGVSALLASKKEEASRLFRSVFADAPLQLAGQFAQMRLVEMGETLSERKKPAMRTDATAIDLSDARASAINWLVDWGLSDLAARLLAQVEATDGQAKRAPLRTRCANWSVIGYGPRGYSLSGELRERVAVEDAATDLTRWAFDCRFPRPYSEVVSEFERDYALPTDLIYAVMRQESGFDPEVTSPANAYGLMQLLPSTAALISAELKATGAEDEDDVRLLFEPRTNIRLGAGYLQKLLRIFKGDLVLSVAAYNAGPKAVALWHRHAEGLPAEVFAARIPYVETRNYVERVLSNLVMYRYLNEGPLGDPKLLLQLPKELELSEDLY